MLTAALTPWTVYGLWQHSRQPAAWDSAICSRRTDRQTDGYLSSFCPLADKGLVHGCERGSVVIDVQQTDEDGNMAALARIICKVKAEKPPSLAAW